MSRPKRVYSPVATFLFIIAVGTHGWAAATHDVGTGQTYLDLSTLVASGVLVSGDTVLLHSDDSSLQNQAFNLTDITVASSDGARKRTISQSGFFTGNGGIFYFSQGGSSTLHISNIILANSTVEGTASTNGKGGAVASEGSLTIADASNVDFIGNLATGTVNAYGNTGRGGAIFVFSELNMQGARTLTFAGNKAVGSNGETTPPIASGVGGAIWAQELNLASASDILFTANEARAGTSNGSAFPVSSSGGGGAIFVMGRELTMTGARNIVFENNIAVGGLAVGNGNADLTGLGGAIGLGYDGGKGMNMQRTITGASFIGNKAWTLTTGDMSSGLGGAIYNSGSYLTLKAEAGGGDIYFSGNTHNPGNLGEKANSIHFGNIVGIPVETQFVVDVDDGALVTMLDPMSSQEDDLRGHSGTTRSSVDLTIDKTGAGTWILAGHNDMKSATDWTIKNGALFLESVNGTGAHLDLSNDGTAKFTVEPGAKLLLNPATTPHVISAREITLESGSLAGIGDGGYFSYQDLHQEANGTTPLLSLRATDSLVNDSTILNPDGVFVSGFFEYSYYGLEWETINPLEQNLVAWIRARRYVPEVGGAGASAGPIAVASQNVVGRTVGDRMNTAFRLMDGDQTFCPEELPPECLPEMEKNLRVWASGLYNYTNAHSGGTYLVRTPGLAVGMEYSDSQTIFLGLAAIAAMPEYRGNHTRIDADTVDLVLYGGTVLPGGIEAGALLSIGRSWYEQKRSVYAERHAANYHASFWSLGADVGRRFMLDESWNIRPFAAYRYLHMSGQGYGERGAGLHALRYDSRSENLHFLRSGMDFGRWNREKGNIAASAYYSGFYGDTEARVGAVFVQDPAGTRYVSYGDRVDRHLFGLGLSANHQVRDNVDLYGSYNFEIGKDSRSQYGNVGMSVSF